MNRGSRKPSCRNEASAHPVARDSEIPPILHRLESAGAGRRSAAEVPRLLAAGADPRLGGVVPPVARLRRTHLSQLSLHPGMDRVTQLRISLRIHQHRSGPGLIPAYRGRNRTCCPCLSGESLSHSRSRSFASKGVSFHAAASVLGLVTPVSRPLARRAGSPSPTLSKERYGLFDFAAPKSPSMGNTDAAAVSADLPSPSPGISCASQRMVMLSHR